MTDRDNPGSQEQVESFDIAIIGMVGRFPGAGNVEQFWHNLFCGVESIAFFTDQELAAMGVSAEALQDPSFVKAGALLENIDAFDASFFGISPREAALMDPQQRIFLECAYEALEQAGYNARAYDGLIGVYAGASLSTYLLFNLLSNAGLIDAQDSFQVMIGNDKDFLSTKVSYHLNLKGPAITVQTGCSTSLVAVHLACQALLGYQCDMALAGGISVSVPQRTGYYYQEGGISSPDGRCRAFDAKAQGTIFGNGVGIVVLKRLEDALAEGDSIYAVVKGSAINNDGAEKLGYTAPGVEGQAEVIVRAQAMSGVEVETIRYIETHGTGTELGDPIEVAALTRAFRMGTQINNFCALGSVKTNIGHLDAAAGIAGLIKTVLALQHKQIPPSLNFEEPNPNIDLANSPFYVHTTPTPWQTKEFPRRAGVSSFGIGGTNAHVILEEAPTITSSVSSRPYQLLLLSARSASALDMVRMALVGYLQQHPGDNLADIAYTLQVGRETFAHRLALVSESVTDAALALERLEPQRIVTLCEDSSGSPVAFMFPGGGAQYVSMGQELYQVEPVFREQIDHCVVLLKPHLGFDLRMLLYPESSLLEVVSPQLKRPAIALPALFSVEYALAKLWMHWGIQPEVMIGHSLGEYVAACLAGVFSLEDALALVACRGRLFEQLPEGAMLSIALPEAEVRGLLKSNLSLAAINGPSQCVVAGRKNEIEELVALLTSREVEFRRLQIDVAAHSELVTPILSQFGTFVEKLTLHLPQIPYISNVTGSWATEEVADSQYWVRHLRQTVRFADGLDLLMKESGRVLLEVGPGQTLSALAKLHAGSHRLSRTFTSIRHPHDRQSDEAFLLMTLARLWMAGVAIDWEKVHQHESRLRIPLPTYPFERQRHWIEPGEPITAARKRHMATGKRPDIAQWFYLPSWKRTSSPAKSRPVQGARWLIFADPYGFGEGLMRQLSERQQEVLLVSSGDSYSCINHQTYCINPQRQEDYEQLCDDVFRAGPLKGIIHMWSLSSQAIETGERGFKEAQQAGYYSLLSLAQALAKKELEEPLQLEIISNHLHDISGDECFSPEKAPLLSPCKVIPQEFPAIGCRCIDVVLPELSSERASSLLEQLVEELCTFSADPVIAYRGKQRWVQSFDPVELNENSLVLPLKKNGIYILIGAFGGIGRLLSEHLARTKQAQLVLVGQRALPPRSEWERWLAGHLETEDISSRIRQIQLLESFGAKVLALSGDIGNEIQMRSIVTETLEQFGAIDGVIHAAGIAGEKAVKLVPEVIIAECEQQFIAKAYGLYVLERVVHDLTLDFCLLFSSNASILGGLGSMMYAAAHLFMDAFAVSCNKKGQVRWLSANWDGWLLSSETQLQASYQTSLDQYAMLPEESIKAFEYLVSMPTVGQQVVSTGDLESRLNIWVRREAQTDQSDSLRTSPQKMHARPEMATIYIPPATELERLLVQVWQEFLGIEQVGIYDNFFDLGGNSLIGLKIIARLKKELQTDIPVVTLFEGPTVSAFARLLEHDQTKQAAYEESHDRGARRREKKLRQLRANLSG